MQPQESHIKKLVTGYNRQLQKLKEQQAIQGLETPVHVLIQIEDLEETINKLKTELETLVDRDFASLSSNRPNIKIPNLSGFFDVPRFADQVTRPDLTLRLHKLVTTYPVVAVEGLSGSGKSYLVSSYAQSNYVRNTPIFWYDPQIEDTLDDLAAHIEVEIELTGLSLVAKCKRLLHILRSQNAILVIDNFEQVDQNSYTTLINMAARYGTPASIILISQIYVDFIRASSHIGHLDIRGFTLSELRTLLANRGLRKMESSTIQDLMDKTDGLPLAASLFATLILDFGRHANDLLTGEILSSTRLRNWFTDICTYIGSKETKLLKFLSICDAAFNIGIVHMACKEELIENGDEVFENLQRAYLIQNYTPYRWNVHRLIAMFTKSLMKPEEKRQKHVAFAKHYLRGSNLQKHRILDDTEFIWKIRACKHFQSAKEYRESESILRNVSKTVKAKGYYEMFIQLSAIELQENHERDTWIDYDHAHCCLITGKLKRSLQVVELLLYTTSEQAQGKHLAIARLYAEILGSMGKYQFALEKLRDTMEKLDLSFIHRTVVNHAKSVEIWLLTKLEQYEQASNLVQSLLAENVQNNDKRGGAIMLTRWGIIQYLSRAFETACKKLEEAVRLFGECDDRRGLAWSLFYLALCELEMNKYLLARKHLQEALQINTDIGESSVDYFDALRKVHDKVSDSKIQKIVNAELQRLNSTFDNVI